MENDDILLWSKDYILNWSDFKATSNPSAFEDSSSHIKFHFTWRIDSEIDNGKICYLIEDVKLSTQFLRHLSWVREGQDSSELLKHEQGHFDLAELNRSKITEQIQNKLYDKKFPTRGKNEQQQKQFAREESGMMIAAELEKLFLDFSKKRAKYDEDTEFGHNLKTQNEYDQEFIEFREKN